jgi:hypothetical protein
MDTNQHQFILMFSGLTGEQLVSMARSITVAIKLIPTRWGYHLNGNVRQVMPGTEVLPGRL